MRFTASLRENRDFRRIYASAPSAVSSCLAVYGRRNRLGTSRLGITVGTKVGNAVVRNRVRRRIKESYRLHEHEFMPGFDVVVVARTRAATAPYAKLEHDLLSISRQLKLLQP